MADDVQPQEGQGDAGTGGLFDSYLQAVPEDARETVESYLKDAEKNVNSRLEEAAELKKTWEPYKDVQDSLSQYDPEQLSELFAWHQQVTASPEAFNEWLAQASKEAGITPQEEQELSEAEESGELTQERVQQIVQEAAEQRFQPMEQQMEAIQAEKAVDVEATAIDHAFGAIQSENGLELTKEQKAVILDLGMPLAFTEKGDELPMGDASWVKGGFDRWKEITTEGQRAFVEQKANQPQGSLTAGGTPKPRDPTDWGEAGEILKERLRAERQ
jgi:hypothetical protein